MMSFTKDEGIGRVRQLYILPDAVGHGVGTLMINMAKSILGSPIRLYTFQDNIGAKRFYERHGFQPIELDDGSGNEENCPAVLYEWLSELIKITQEELPAPKPKKPNSKKK